ncbi:unnamed protein product [Closterium sp. NIES-65]|nr:unnamed protein product [Closterium sp. NIES-65]
MSMSLSLLEEEEEQCECDSIGSGLPGTSGYRLKFTSAHGAEVSPWHQLPLPASVPVPPPPSPSASDLDAPCFAQRPGRVSPSSISHCGSGREHANFAELLAPSPRRSACPAPLRFVCQTPRGSVVAFDVAVDEPATPLRLRRAPTAAAAAPRSTGTSRSAGSRSPSSSPPRLARPLALAAPCSCGFLPQTCALELPRALLSVERGGLAEKVDGAEAGAMPMMAVEIGLSETWTGDVRRVIPLAAMTVCVPGSRGNGNATEVAGEIAVASDAALSGESEAHENRGMVASRDSTDGTYGRMMWVVVTIATDDPEAGDVWRFMRKASEATIEGIVSGVRRWLEDVYLQTHMPPQGADTASFQPSTGIILPVKLTSRLLMKAHEAWKKALPSLLLYQPEPLQQQRQQQLPPLELQRSACIPSSKQQHQSKPIPAVPVAGAPPKQQQAYFTRPPRSSPSAASPKPPRHRGHVSPPGKGSPKQNTPARRQESLPSLFLFEPDNVVPADRPFGLCLSEDALVPSAGSHGGQDEGGVDLFQSALSVSPGLHSRRSSSSGSSAFGSFDGEECLSSAGSLDLDGGIADVLKWRHASKKRLSPRRSRHGEGAVRTGVEGGQQHHSNSNSACGLPENLLEAEPILFLRETSMSRSSSNARRRTVRFDEVVEVHVFDSFEEDKCSYSRTLTFIKRQLTARAAVRGCGASGCADVEAADARTAMEIGAPFDVKHVVHVTFDRYKGFIGLPDELLAHVDAVPPSASLSVFGVRPVAMHYSVDAHGTSVPSILLLLQSRLYQLHGLSVEGIFRIAAQMEDEDGVRSQLSSGVLPPNLDVHSLAGLIKAWFRELPEGLLDLFTPNQVAGATEEAAATALAETLPAIHRELLDWVINLMADVVEHEAENKMNARNIALVFAPNMTQVIDPMIGLQHAVRVMEFLRALVEKRRNERAAMGGSLPELTRAGADSTGAEGAGGQGG